MMTVKNFGSMFLALIIGGMTMHSWLVLFTICYVMHCYCLSVRASGLLDYEVELTKASSGYDRTSCWVHARAGAIPPKSPGNSAEMPIVVMTMQKLLLSGSDVFYALHDLRTDDLAKSWSRPKEHQALGRRQLDEHREIVASDFTPQWHAQTNKLLGTGHTVTYFDNAIRRPYDRWTAYSVYDPVMRSWTPWQKLEMPDLRKFRTAGAGSTQRYDLPNGDILLPIYFNEDPERFVCSVTVVRCHFDGEYLRYVEHGDELKMDTDRGLVEPSITKFGDRFYLTVRHDKRGYVTSSDDGLHYKPLREWTFDDGSDLGNYNTQQHWVTHSDGLFLVYTRRGASNDHVFRHRAPLFMAQVDPQSLRVIRSTERILVPQRGARLGNFGVVDVAPDQTWVIAAEWMQSKTRDPRKCEKYGSDNSIFVAKIHWHRPNRLWTLLPGGSPDASAGQDGRAPAGR